MFTIQLVFNCSVRKGSLSFSQRINNNVIILDFREKTFYFKYSLGIQEGDSHSSVLRSLLPFFVSRKKRKNDNFPLLCLSTIIIKGRVNLKISKRRHQNIEML